jgi:hypothetical protein
VALEIKHKFQSLKPDGTDDSVVKPSNWNDTHVIEINGPGLIGKPDLGDGEAVEIKLSDDLVFDGDELKLNPQLHYLKKNEADQTYATQQALTNLGQATADSLTALDQSIPGKVRAAVLTGLSLAAGEVIAATDTVLVALGKLQKQITDACKPNAINVFTKAQRSRGLVLAPEGTVYTPDFGAALFFRFIPGANFTLANPTNMPEAGDHQSGSFFITQDATGNRTITFGNLYQAAGGLSTIVLSTAPNAKDRIDYLVTASGNIDISIAKDRKA